MPALVINHAAVGVDGNYSSHHRTAGEPQAGGPDPAFDRSFHAESLTHSSAGAGSNAAFPCRRGAGGPTGGMAFFWAGVYPGCHQSQIEQDGRRYNRDRGWTYQNPDALLRQIADHAGGRVQAECAATAKHQGVQSVYSVHRTQQVGLPGSRRTAPDVDAPYHTLAAEDYGAAGAIFPVGVVADLQTSHGSDGGVQLDLQGSREAAAQAKGKPRRSGA